MSDETRDDARRDLDAIYRVESRRVLATLIRLIGDFDLAEEALHEAFVAAMEQWPRQGVPDNPRAWLVSTGRFKAIDTIRRRSRFAAAQTELTREMLARADELATSPLPRDIADDVVVEDDRLRLIFTCCHPAITPDARVALTLKSYQICPVSLSR